MKYNVECDIFKTYPELLNYEEFTGEEKDFDLARAFTYVALVYDPESSMFKIADVLTRKEKAYKMAGLPPMLRGSIIQNQNTRINSMVRRFFILLNRPEIELYLSGQEAIHTLLEEARRPVTDDLQDDKRTTALKAKRMCFEDAMVIMDKVKKLGEQLDTNKVDIKEVNRKMIEEKEDEWSNRDFVEQIVIGKKK